MTAVKKEQPLEDVKELRLMGEGPFSAVQRWPEQQTEALPRALRSLASIVNEGLCHRCGSCVGICPQDVLEPDKEEYPAVKNLSACTDCDLCVKVCPGDEFDVFSIYKEQYESEVDLLDTHGSFQEAVIAHALDPDIRKESTSGGLVTTILLNLLEQGQIDGALVISSADDPIWKGKPIIARTREELLGAMKSKYAISPTNAALSEIRKLPGKYALVGLPCQIHGFIKAAKLSKELRERVVLTIGLFCHAAIEHEAFEIIWGKLGPQKDEAVKFISRVGKHPGTPHLKLRDGTLYPVYFPDKKGYRPSSMDMINVLYRLYTPNRCMLCFDALSEFADISVGDPWMPAPAKEVDFKKGWSMALLRTARGIEAFRAAEAAKLLESISLNRKQARVCNQHMAVEKKRRALRVLERYRKSGRSVPHYGTEPQSLPTLKGMPLVQAELNLFTHIFCFLRKGRSWILRFFLSNGGYQILWLNSLRKRLKHYLKGR